MSTNRVEASMLGRDTQKRPMWSNVIDPEKEGQRQLRRQLREARRAADKEKEKNAEQMATIESQYTGKWDAPWKAFPKGHFERRDLGKIDPSEFPAYQHREEMSIDELEQHVFNYHRLQLPRTRKVLMDTVPGSKSSKRKPSDWLEQRSQLYTKEARKKIIAKTPGPNAAVAGEELQGDPDLPDAPRPFLHLRQGRKGSPVNFPASAEKEEIEDERTTDFLKNRRKKKLDEFMMGDSKIEVARQRLASQTGDEALEAQELKNLKRQERMTFFSDAFSRSDNQTAELASGETERYHTRVGVVDRSLRRELRKYVDLPWHEVEGGKSWTDLSDKQWQDLGIDGGYATVISDHLRGYGVLGPNVLQEKSARSLLVGNDTILTAMTGSGKTLAFLMPLLKRVVLPLIEQDSIKQPPATKKAATPALMILAPSRELAAQTFRVVSDLLEPWEHIHIMNLIGGPVADVQAKALRKSKPVIVVGTPGRIADMIVTKALSMEDAQAVVFDEIDKLMNVSRKDHLRLLNKELAPMKTLQRVIVSASCGLTGRAAQFARDHLRPNWQIVGPQYKVELPPRVLHIVNPAPEFDKKILFLKRLQGSEPGHSGVLVFVGEASRAYKVRIRLEELGIPVGSMSSNDTASQRMTAIQKMDDGEIDMLVATDIAAYGLDFRGLSHVVNFDLPYDSISYAHRAGRCGRHGNQGVVISLGVAGTCNSKLQRISKELNFKIYEGNVQYGKLQVVENLEAVLQARVRPDKDAIEERRRKEQVKKDRRQAKEIADLMAIKDRQSSVMSWKMVTSVDQLLEESDAPLESEESEVE